MNKQNINTPPTKSFLLSSSTQSNPIASIISDLLPQRKSREHADTKGESIISRNFINMGGYQKKEHTQDT